MADEHIPLIENTQDEDIRSLFNLDTPYEQLLEDLTTDDILVPSKEAKVPFFASIRDYQGAYYQNDENSLWLIKRIGEQELAQARLGMFVYFMNHFTGTVSAPTIVTKINGRYHKASKIIPRTEQLSGAPYHENKYLSAQLALDLINSWIYFDEDRNPNNYLIYYNGLGIPVVIAIDFSNVDLLTSNMKIKGRTDTFGWERQEKTRYMTPLKSEQLYQYSFEFYKVRLQKFRMLTEEVLNTMGNAIFRDASVDSENGSEKTTVQEITKNVLARVEYVYSYFEGWFNDPEKRKLLNKRSKEEMKQEYRLMGRFFNENLNQ